MRVSLQSMELIFLFIFFVSMNVTCVVQGREQNSKNPSLANGRDVNLFFNDHHMKYFTRFN